MSIPEVESHLIVIMCNTEECSSILFSVLVYCRFKKRIIPSSSSNALIKILSIFTEGWALFQGHMPPKILISMLS